MSQIYFYQVLILKNQKLYLRKKKYKIAYLLLIANNYNIEKSLYN